VDAIEITITSHKAERFHRIGQNSKPVHGIKSSIKDANIWTMGDEEVGLYARTQNFLRAFVVQRGLLKSF